MTAVSGTLAVNGTLSFIASGAAVGFSVDCELLLSGLNVSALSVEGTVSTTSGNASTGLTGTILLGFGSGDTTASVVGGLLIT